jgi:hypothetical protein
MILDDTLLANKNRAEKPLPEMRHGGPKHQLQGCAAVRYEQKSVTGYMTGSGKRVCADCCSLNICICEGGRNELERVLHQPTSQAWVLAGSTSGSGHDIHIIFPDPASSVMCHCHLLAATTTHCSRQ